MTSHSDNEIATAIDSLKQAMLMADRALLDRLCAEALSYGHSNGRVETKQEFVAANVASPPIWTSIVLSDQTIQVSDDTAVVRHTMVANSQRDGKVTHVKIAVLLIWQKQEVWKLLARQAVKL